jgi:hypothetical protein
MNSPESTGPHPSAEKPASRYNAAKHGIVAATQIMFDESVDDLAGLAAEYHQHHNPADSDQRFLVDTLVHNEWRLRRLRRVEAELWDHATNTFLAENTEAPACSSGDAFATASGEFLRLQRVVNFCEQNYHRSLKELQRLKVKVGQALPPANAPASPRPLRQNAGPAPTAAQPPQPEQSKTSSAKLGSFRQNPKTPPGAAPKTPSVTPVTDPNHSRNAAETPQSAADRDVGEPEAGHGVPTGVAMDAHPPK